MTDLADRLRELIKRAAASCATWAPTWCDGRTPRRRRRLAAGVALAAVLVVGLVYPGAAGRLVGAAGQPR